MDCSRRPSLCDKSGSQLRAQQRQYTRRWRNRHSQDHNPSGRKLWTIRYFDVKSNKSNTSGSVRENATTQETWSKIMNLWIQWAVMVSLTKMGFIKRSLSFLTEEIISVNPVGRFDIDSAIVGMQELYIRPSSQDVWKRKNNRLWIATSDGLSHAWKVATRESWRCWRLGSGFTDEDSLPFYCSRCAVPLWLKWASYEKISSHI